jgi:hypothetical protein
LAAIEQHLALLPDQLSFLLQESLHGASKLSFDDVMDAARRFRVQTPKLLEAPAGAGFETFQA